MGSGHIGEVSMQTCLDINVRACLKAHFDKFQASSGADERVLTEQYFFLRNSYLTYPNLGIMMWVSRCQ